MLCLIFNKMSGKETIGTKEAYVNPVFLFGLFQKVISTLKRTSQPGCVPTSHTVFPDQVQIHHDQNKTLNDSMRRIFPSFYKR